MWDVNVFTRIMIRKEEFDGLRFQSGTSKEEQGGRGGRRYYPYAYTEQGISMLASVMHSKVEMLVDDVGGIHGFSDFLQNINPELKGLDPDEKEEAKKEKKEGLEWARSLGWHKDKVSNFNLL